VTDTESSERTPEFSLIVTTKDRTSELAKLLRSLDCQRLRSFELIVSDQNADDRLLPVLAPFRQRFPLRHIRSSGGASRGRNAGLPLATGRCVGFPDDDCWYPPDLLATVARLFRDHSDWHIVCGRSVDDAMRNTQGRWLDDVTQANRRNVLRIGIEYTIFARAAALAAAGPFDEALGVGAGTPWGSGEATDFLLSAIEARQTWSIPRKSTSTTRRKWPITPEARAIGSLAMREVSVACSASTAIPCSRPSSISRDRLPVRRCSLPARNLIAASITFASSPAATSAGSIDQTGRRRPLPFAHRHSSTPELEDNRLRIPSGIEIRCASPARQARSRPKRARPGDRASRQRRDRELG
jgi:Glycosyl transferase family 2